MEEVIVIRWQDPEAPMPEELATRLESEGLSFYRWSNGPGYRYSAHEHSYEKVILVERGSIVFGLPEAGKEILLETGDRLELPAGIRHNARVGNDGVVCLEAHR